MMNFIEERNAIIEICRRMHSRWLISGGQGNVSIRLTDDLLLITPSGPNKGFLRPEELVLADMDATPEDPFRKVSSEVKVHLAAYRSRQDCRSVVHGHPISAVALTLAEVGLETVYLPETAITLGTIPTGKYNTPSSCELADDVGNLTKEHNVVMMERHGAVCLGKDVFTAYDRLESLEHNSRIVLTARLLSELSPLPADEVKKLLAMGTAMNY